MRTRPWDTWPKRNNRDVWHWRGDVLSTAEADELIHIYLPSFLFSLPPPPLSCLHLIVFSVKKLCLSELILGGLLKEILLMWNCWKPRRKGHQGASGSGPVAIAYTKVCL